jgi:uncharacterized repeat protein (TIGR02543 family)
MAAFFSLRIRFLTVAAAWCLACTAFGERVYEDYTFTTLAGPASVGAGYMDGTNSQARFNLPGSIARDTNGNLYIADIVNQVIRKVSPDGKVTTFAGQAGMTGTADGPASEARFNNPNGLALGSDGNLYIADTFNHTVRKITPSGDVSTLAGSAGQSGYLNGWGSAARFSYPVGVAVDTNGNVYVADTSNHTIRRITPAGLVTRVAGQPGFPGSLDGKSSPLGKAGRFNNPFSLTLDSSGNIYVADYGNDTIRKITPAGAVTTIAGIPGFAGSVDGTNATAQFSSPEGVAVDAAGNVFVADAGNNAIRRVTPQGVVTTVAGLPGTSGSADGGNGTNTFNAPGNLTVDASGNIYVVDSDNHTIRTISPGGDVLTLAGQAPASPGAVDGPADKATFTSPQAVALDSATNVWVADTFAQLIRKITADGVVSTIAGTNKVSGTNDGIGTTARFNQPRGLAFDTNGNLYVADTVNSVIRRMAPDGTVATIAGAGTNGIADGTNNRAQFNQPRGVVVDTNGIVYVADTGNQTIRRVQLIDTNWVVTTILGAPLTNGVADGTNTDARFNQPGEMAIDTSGTIYLADTGNQSVRKLAPVDTNWVVTTLAGTNGVVGNDDGTNGTARFFKPGAVALDITGNVFVADTENQMIRKISPSGVVTTIGGKVGESGNTDGTGQDARFSGPSAIAADVAGNVYVADPGNGRVRKGYPALPDKPVVDIPVGPVGLMRQLDVTNLTTVTWYWDFVRYPATSSAQLSSNTARNPTFTPDVADLFVIRFRGWDAEGRLVTGTVSLGADAANPIIRVKAPTDGQQVSNSVLTVTGEASDDIAVSNIWLRVNGGTWTNVPGSNTWSSDLTLTPRTNLIEVFAEDTSGKFSSTNSVTVTYWFGDQLNVTINGVATLTPNYAGQFLEIGTNYQMTIAGAIGFTFLGWTGSQTSSSPTLSFEMQSNLTFTANFTESVRPSVAITYPKPGQQIGNGGIYVSGTAKDNWRVTNVWFQLNGNSWASAAGTANWYAPASLSPGLNTVRVYAADPVGNLSPTNQVSFTYNPFLASRGTYAGLFIPSTGVAHTNSGFFTATVTTNGSISGRIVAGGGTYPFAGKFALAGSFSKTVVAAGFPPLSVQLQADYSSGAVITGSVSDGVWTANLSANRLIYSASSPAPQAGRKYTLAIPGADDASTRPGGYSSGSLSVATNGTIAFNGTLGEGTAVAQQTFVAGNGQWPFYSSLYSGKGSIFGWLSFTNGADRDIAGTVSWFRNPGSAVGLYTSGFEFTNELAAIGSRYTNKTGVAALNITNALLTLEGGNLDQSITNDAAIGTNNLVTGSNGLKLTITNATGIFIGSVSNTFTGAAITVKGAVLQKENKALGTFLGATQSGRVRIE